MKNFSHFVEEKDNLVLEPLPFKDIELEGVMSKATIDYHYTTLAAGYVKRFNKVAGSLRNAFRCSVTCFLLEVELLDGRGVLQDYQRQPNSECQ